MPAHAAKIIRRFKLARSKRNQWNTHWQDVADFVLPTRDFTVVQPGGIRRRQKIYDDTAPNAHEELSSTLDGLLTSKTTQWFALQLTDTDLVDDQEVRLWLERATNIMLRWLNNPNSQFALSIYEIYLDLIAFGTAIMLMRNDPDAIRFQAMPLANVYLEEDDRETVITIYRHIMMAAHLVKARWGNAVSQRVAKLADNDKTADNQIELIHCVQKRDDRDPQRLDGKNKPWASIYVEVKDQRILSEGGFDENPYLTPRFSKAAGEVYGRSPAMKALPSIKTVNVMQQTILKAGAKAVDPPLNVPAGSMEGPVRTGPAGLNYYRAGSTDRIEPVNTGANPRLGHELLAAERQMVENAFYLDKIRLPGLSPKGGHPRMTIPEVVERREQALVFFSPILDRLYAELLSLIIVRLFNGMRKRNQIPPPPDSANGRELKIAYLGPLALAQRASEVTSVVRLLNVAAPLISANPNVLDVIDDDEAIRLLADSLNASPRIIRTREQVEQRRQSRQDQEALAQQAEIAQQLAKAGRDAAAGIKDVTSSAA